MIDGTVYPVRAGSAVLFPQGKVHMLQELRGASGLRLGVVGRGLGYRCGVTRRLGAGADHEDKGRHRDHADARPALRPVPR